MSIGKLHFIIFMRISCSAKSVMNFACKLLSTIYTVTIFSIEISFLRVEELLDLVTT